MRRLSRLRDESLYIDDMREACANIVDFIGDRDQVGFFADKKTLHAVVRNLEILGEAAKKLTQETKSKYPGVEWELIAGLRNRIVHEYFQLDPAILWDTVKNEVPTLIKALGGE